MNWPADFIDKVICGDCLGVLQGLPDGSVDMVMTSPPYFTLRDYGVEQIFGGDGDCEHEWGIDAIKKMSGGKGKSDDYKGMRWESEIKTCFKCQAWKGQLGLEPTPELYIEHMTAVFHEVKRVLRKDGTLWLNIGDTYNAGRSGGWAGGKKGISKPENSPNQSGVNVPGLKSKCLCMIPERLAWSLIQDGWILRNKIIWYKPSGMPSSAKDRFTNKYEFVYMFSKNNETILWQHKETREWVNIEPLGINGKEGIDWEWKEGKKPGERKKASLWPGFTYYFDLDAVREAHADDNIGIRPSKRGINPKYQNLGPEFGAKQLAIQNFNPLGKNPGDIFFIKGRKKSGRKYENIPGQEPHSIARHSGYYDENGKCLVDFEKGKNPGDFWSIPTQPFPEAHFAVFPEKLCEKPIKAGSKEGDIILDPFCGAGTVLLVAKNFKRHYIGIDIKKEFCKMSEKRISQGVL